ncbi:MAG: adenylate/guanylate cyclase domain-containing protein [Chloroflexi bacterium]|nr:adenylate/guanylate cyclase domain-containing protein [Chloroflexota bacterium]
MAAPDSVPSDPKARENEAFWRNYLENYNRAQGMARPFLSKIPSNPRCVLCGSPFHGFGGGLMKMIGKAQSAANPRMCNACENVMLKHHGGAEVSASMLFADVRGSTALAETMTAGEFRDQMDRFYAAASGAVFANNGVVDKFVGDEVVAVFAPMLGMDHSSRAVNAGLDLLRATGHADPDGPWVPVGAGIHTGKVWFGVVGEGGHVELTVLGDPVNTTARLAAQAGTGELLVSTDAATVAGLDPDLERRSLDLKGKAQATEVVTLRVDGA